ncbi:anthranilate phosphoribosyltransferase [Risungbinella massiliensis]|uniref:anthranilate phosphoribosyltransferase n=1 Tax=Risungbinella massiliensis TaxID=1329796 RepID=UPI000A6AA3DB|nr:anthranilate phosphoribosyltransferase [Risungbinella massiliensis]
MNLYLRKISEREDLTEKEAYQALLMILEDQVSDTEISAFLMGLKAKGETTTEIVGIVKALLEKAMSFSFRIPHAMDNCGTGGDQSQSFNVSTTTAFVLSGAGIKVAKHGNRAISSRSGSADVLEYLGIHLTCSGEQVEELLERVGISFLFAPHVHPGLGKVMKVRKELNIPTIFNLIGPLTNPVRLESQLLGIYQRKMVVPFARILNQLGRKRAVVLNGYGNLDEASLAGENYLALLENGQVKELNVHPTEFGLKTIPNSEICGGNVQENAEILVSVLKGETGVYRDTVLFNAGIGLFASGKVNDIQDGIELAKESIDSGAALEKFMQLREYSRRLQKGVS